MIGMAGGGQAGTAAGMGVLAAQQQRAIDFTRANEMEADRVGIQMLVEAGYDPRAMPAFFEKLQNASRFYRRPPEFLSTHPMTTSRIADTRGRAEQYPVAEHTDSFSYHLVRAKLRVMLEREPEKAVDYFEKALESREYANVHAAAYGWALALSRAGQHQQAGQVLRELQQSYPNVVPFRAALAENALAANRVDEALDLYREGYDLFPDNRILVRGYTAALLRAGRGSAALEVIDDYARLYGMDGPLQRMAAEGYQQTGKQAQSQLSLAEYYYTNGQLVQAVQQLRQASAAPDRDFYIGSRVEARLAEIEEEMAESGRR
jgi:predicted Zn-dependent protease